MNKQSKKGIIVLTVIALVVTVTIVLSIVLPRVVTFFSNKGNVTNAKLSEDFIEVNFSSYKKDFIAALYIEGVIEEKNYDYDHEWLMNTIYSLKDNENNVALAIYIDSPGGGCYQADEVYLALQDYKTTGRPIYVYQGPLAASGGYYISCAADQIYANRNTLTGCIGVIFGQSFDLTGLYEKLGIKSKTFHSGRNKTMLYPDEPLTEEQEDIMQSLCDDSYEQFVKIVANGRGMTYEKAKELSDGRLYTANQGLENGLIDRIDSWDNMLTVLAEDTLEKPGIKVIDFKKAEEVFNIFDIMLYSFSKLSEKEASAKLGLPSSVFNYSDFNSYPAYLCTEF